MQAMQETIENRIADTISGAEYEPARSAHYQNEGTIYALDQVGGAAVEVEYSFQRKVCTLRLRGPGADALAANKARDWPRLAYGDGERLSAFLAVLADALNAARGT